MVDKTKTFTERLRERMDKEFAHKKHVHTSFFGPKYDLIAEGDYSWMEEQQERDPATGS